MLMMPPKYYEFPNPKKQVDYNISNFMFYLMKSGLVDNIYREEYFGKETKTYSLLSDIMILYDRLINIHYDIMFIRPKMTYNEYLDKYNVRCILDRLSCNGIDSISLLSSFGLLIEFDEGYSKPNEIPDVEDPDNPEPPEHDEKLGIGYYRIKNENESKYNDFKIK